MLNELQCLSPNVGVLTKEFILINIKWLDDDKDYVEKENEKRTTKKHEKKSTQKATKYQIYVNWNKQNRNERFFFKSHFN